MTDGRPMPDPMDATVVLTGLARTLARLHDGRLSAPDRVVVESLEPHQVVALAAVAVSEHGGSNTGPGATAGPSPYSHLSPSRLLRVLRDGVAHVETRGVSPVTTIGRATIENLDVSLLATAGVTTPGAIGSAPFRDWGRAATADPYRDLAVASASVVGAFGPGAVLGFMDAYTAERPSVEPIDLVRLDWWSLALELLDAP